MDAAKRAQVQEALTWLGIPYHHHARVKGVGVDCAQLLCAVYVRQHKQTLVHFVDWTVQMSETTQSLALDHAKSILTAHEHRYRKSAWAWRFMYRLFLVLSAVFSSAAAIVHSFESIYIFASKDISSILAAAAAVLTTVIAALDFEVNTRVNRKSRHQVSLLLLEAEKTGADPDDLITRLQEVVSQRSEDLNKAD
jgi:hypothetical protein